MALWAYVTWGGFHLASYYAANIVASSNYNLLRFRSYAFRSCGVEIDNKILYHVARDENGLHECKRKRNGDYDTNQLLLLNFGMIKEAKLQGLQNF